MPLVQKDYYSTQEALERVRLAVPLEDIEQNLIEVLALGKCTAWFIDQAGERCDIPTELWKALLNHRSINCTYNVLEVDWETGKVLCLWECGYDWDSITSRGRRGVLRFDREQLDLLMAQPSHSASPWDLLDTYTIEQAICLLSGKEPRGLEPERRRRLLPNSVAVENFLWAKMWAGEIITSKVPVLWKMLHETQGEQTPYHPDIEFSRDALKKLYESGADRPKFLFPEGERPAKPGLTRGNPRKRGRVPWTTTAAIRKMIPIVETAIGGPATPTAMWAYFKKEGITKSTPRTFHEDFKDAYIEKRHTLHWKDRRGNHHKMELTSLGAHRRALEKA